MSLPHLDPRSTSSSSFSASQQESPTASYAKIGSLLRRPVTPAPAPLVLITGAAGVGNRAVAECLLLLVGGEKAFLVDDSLAGVVLGRGLDHFLGNPTPAAEPAGRLSITRKNGDGGLYSRREAEKGRRGSAPEPAQGGRWGGNNSHGSLMEERRRRSLQPYLPSQPTSPDEEGTGEAAGPRGCVDGDEQGYEDTMSTPLPLTPAHPDMAAAAAAGYFDEVAAPSHRLFDHLLRHPANRQRIAILAAAPPDTHALAAAVSRAGRPFVLVKLQRTAEKDWEEGEERNVAAAASPLLLLPARSRSLGSGTGPRKKNKNKERDCPAPGGKPRSKTWGSAPLPPLQGQERKHGVRLDGALGQDPDSNVSAPPATSHANSSLRLSILSPLPPPAALASPPPLLPRAGAQCATGCDGDGAFFTVEMSRAQTLEPALRIMEHVNLVVSERDAGLCSSGSNISAPRLWRPRWDGGSRTGSGLE